ncbi:MAG: peptidoglycan binding domain-containing protein [Clostridiales bacterium]|nr:peptidoglycan binding domain-containing protein [Clostridiales bacterium]
MAKKRGKAAKSGKAKKIVLGILIGYVLIMLIGYLGVSFYFSSHFLKGTTINGIDSSNKTVKQVKDIIQDRIGEYKLRVVELDGKTETISAIQVNMTYVDDNKVDELMEEQDHWKWITSLSNESSFELAANTTYDQSLLDGILDDMSCFQEENVVAPQDAYIQEKDGLYEIVPEVVGNTIDREKMKAAIIEAIDTGKTEINLEELGCYLKPSVYQDNEGLISERDAKNKMMKTNLTYDFGDRTEKVDASVVKDWIIWGEEEGQWTISKEKAAEFVQQLAYKYDTFGLTHEFTTYAGEKITLKGGDYGWVMKKKETTDALVAAILEGQTGTIEPVYLYEGKCRDTNDIGGTYVEISLEEQRMWCYKDGALIVDTPIVTGNPSKGYETPSGSVWAIDAKKSPDVLEGEGYKQPVTYWMPFVGNVGIHDADTWRTEYGGEIYKTNGSHGCVNTPTANAEKIFNTVEIGTPVIVY